jgi:hypothetical protein
MSDVETTFRAELNRMLVVDAAPDWTGVLAAAGERGSTRRRRFAVAFAALLGATVLALATPLGGAIARGLDEFSTWLTGHPGDPVSEEQQRTFDTDVRRWRLGFPAGTELRSLISRRVGGSTIELLGVRSGGRLCLRLRVSGVLTGGAFECAPLADLRRARGPVRVLITDKHLIRGMRVAWYGVARPASAQLRITAGIAADDIDAVVLRDDSGRHEIPVESNAFLYVNDDIGLGQRVREVWARTATGLVEAPFTPIATVFGSSPTIRREPPAAPVVERAVTGGTIGWLEDREERGEPPEVLPKNPRREHINRLFRQRVGLPDQVVVFGRVLAPNQDHPLRYVVTLVAHRAGGRVAEVCVGATRFRGIGGDCDPFPVAFDRTPFRYAMGGGGPGLSDAFVTIDGLASDDVARLEILLADGTRVDVPLADNAFIADVSRAGLPGRIVAYDSEDRVISSSETLLDWASMSSCCVSPGPGEPALGKVSLLWRADGPAGSNGELAVGPSTLGDECMHLKIDLPGSSAGPSIQCAWKPLGRSPVQVNAGWRGRWRFVNGRVREDVKTVRIRFGDGMTVTLRPRRGYVLYALPADRLRGERRAVGAEGLDASGRVVGRRAFPKRFR